MEESSLSGQVAVVTGATRGIGLAISRQLRRLGARVFGIGRDETLLASLATEGIEPLAVDVSDETAVRESIETILARAARIDILINNAGIGVFGSVDEIAWSDFRRTLDVNVGGTFLCTRSVVPTMRQQGSGDVINIASVVGVKGYPNQTAYGASKHAVIGFTKALAAELHGTGIRVRSVCPGAVDTDLVESARSDLDRQQLIRPEDVAEAVAFLLCGPPSAIVDNINIRRAGSPPWF